jgi:hypothetical protein
VSARRVFVIWTYPIFHESVRLLLDHPDIEWVGATSDYATAKDEIFGLRPDTILIEEATSNVKAEIMRILESSPWSVRVIGLSLADNRLSIYHRQDWTVAHTDDLLHLILSESMKG